MPNALANLTTLSLEDDEGLPQQVESAALRLEDDDSPSAPDSGLRLEDDDSPAFAEPEIITTVHRFGFSATTAVAPEPEQEGTEVAPSNSADGEPDEIERLVANYSRSDLVVSGAFTEWQHLRDYVVAALEDRFGRFPRNPIKEKAIFSSFFDRWGDRAEPIARRAVEVHNCWWMNAPISVNRFAKGSDPYFAAVLVTQL